MRANPHPILYVARDAAGAAEAPEQTPRLPNGVPAVVDRDARLLREAMSRCRRDVSSPVTDAHVRNLIKKVDSGRAQPARAILEMLYDAFSRGAPREAVEQPSRVLLALVGEWFERRDRTNQLDFLTLMLRETEAEARADVAQMRLSIDRTPKSVADASDLIDAHLGLLEALSEALHRERAAA